MVVPPAKKPKKQAGRGGGGAGSGTRRAPSSSVKEATAELNKLKVLGKKIREAAEDENKDEGDDAEGSGTGRAPKVGKSGGGGGGSSQNQSIVGEAALSTGVFRNTSGLSIDEQGDLYGANAAIANDRVNVATKKRIDLLIAQGDYVGAGGVAAEDALRRNSQAVAALSEAAQRQAGRDFSQYTGINDNASAVDAIQALAQKLAKDTGMGMEESRKAAEEQWNAQVAKNSGPSGEGGGSGSGSASGGRPADPMAGVMSLLGDISDMLSEHLGAIDEKLPLSALS